MNFFDSKKLKCRGLLSGFFISVFVIGTWAPLFAKCSFWEEWGWTEDGEEWANGGIELVRSTFLEAMGSSYLTLGNVALNVGLLILYSLIVTALIHKSYVLYRKFLSPSSL